MRIGMVFSTPFPPVEGIGFYVWNLSRHLVELGHQVQIITRGGARLTRSEILDGIKVWHATFIPAYPYHVQFHNLFVQELVNRLEAKLDILHLHSPLVHYLNTRLPTLVTVHTPVKAGVAFIPATNWIGRLIKLQSFFSYRIETSTFSRADRLVATANTVANELEQYGVNPSEVKVLGNGVDETIFYPVSGIPQAEPPYVLTVCRLAPRKGLEDLLGCARIVSTAKRNIQFLIAGSGPLKGELKRQIKRLNLDGKVILLGHVADRSRLADLYRRAAIYVHPAHYEGMATAILEAMACAKPVIATAVGGALENIQNGSNGILVEPKNALQMANMILKILAEPQVGKELGIQACATIQQHYTWEVVTRNYLAEYQAIQEGANPLLVHSNNA